VNLIYLKSDIGSTEKVAHINLFSFTPNSFSLPPSGHNIKVAGLIECMRGDEGPSVSFFKWSIPRCMFIWSIYV